MDKLSELYLRMVEWDKGHVELIQHFAKVHDFSRLIGQAEGLDERTMYVLEAASLVHDIGILPAREKYGNGHGKYQEMVSDGPVREMLGSLGFDTALIDRVAYLVCHHHTYDCIEGMDYQILVEADFLVNLHEHNNYCGEGREACEAAFRNIFRTSTGKRLCEAMFLQ